jgi:hypothetical protein
MPTTNYWSLDTESGYNSGAINPTLVARAIRGYRLLLLVATLGLSLWTIVNEFLDRRYVFGFSLSLATIVVSVIACVRHSPARPLLTRCACRLTAMLVSPWTSGPVVLEIAISVALGTTWIVQAGADDYTSTVINVWVAVLAIRA